MKLIILFTCDSLTINAQYELSFSKELLQHLILLEILNSYPFYFKKKKKNGNVKLLLKYQFLPTNICRQRQILPMRFKRKASCCRILQENLKFLIL